jgi:ABC-type multidrug transport system ATPase subunit/pSer/pThr/pTyr-binding forkhead associated (FHA) protein
MDQLTVLPARGVVATLDVQFANGGRESLPVGTSPITIGRADDNTVVTKEGNVSRHHCEIVRRVDGGYVLRDTSTNGTTLNGAVVHGENELHGGEVIKVGGVMFTFTVPPPPGAPDRSDQTMLASSPRAAAAAAGVAAPDDAVGMIAASIALERGRVVTIGRAEENDLVLDHPQVSRRHARVEWDGKDFVLTDLGSTNGTFVNDARAPRVALTEDARVQIGPFRYTYAQNALRWQQDTIRLDVVGLTRRVEKGVVLLHDISLSLLPKEFVCIVGGSGTGKSTLMNALSGVSPATNGQVVFNGTDYYAHLDEFRSLIGYVPQDDIVPMQLTVQQALTYAARLRLPPDTKKAEIRTRVEEVMRDLDILSRRNTPITKLSGGQRKRVSIGAELLTKPTLFFLDEPTSGLDPGLESDMMEMMARLANQGRTILLVTHATQNITTADMLIFMALGGYLAFFGPPQEALAFFGVKTFAEIYKLLRTPEAAVQWAEKYAQSDYRTKYVDERLESVRHAREQQHERAAPVGVVEDSKLRRAETRSQFRTLTARYLTMIRSDRRNLIILLLQAPIIGILLGVLYGRDVFRFILQPQPDGTVHFVAHAEDAFTITALLVVVALWFGASNSAREIVKEASVYRRERMINLRLGPYLLSKLVVLMSLCLVQNAMMLGILGIFSPYHLQKRVNATTFVPILHSWPKAYVTMLAVSLAGVAIGLLISSIVENADRAASIVPIVLIPQILFSGSLVRWPDLFVAGRVVSFDVAGNWGVQAVGRASGVGAMLDAISPPGKSPFFTTVSIAVAALLIMAVVAFVGTVIALKRKDVRVRNRAQPARAR